MKSTYLVWLKSAFRCSGHILVEAFFCAFFFIGVCVYLWTWYCLAHLLHDSLLSLLHDHRASGRSCSSSGRGGCSGRLWKDHWGKPWGYDLMWLRNATLVGTAIEAADPIVGAVHIQLTWDQEILSF